MSISCQLATSFTLANNAQNIIIEIVMLHASLHSAHVNSANKHSSRSSQLFGHFCIVTAGTRPISRLYRSQDIIADLAVKSKVVRQHSPVMLWSIYHGLRSLLMSADRRCRNLNGFFNHGCLQLKVGRLQLAVQGDWFRRSTDTWPYSMGSTVAG